MEKLITSADLGKAIYLDPSKKPSVTFLKVPRKLKKKMKKNGVWGMPVIMFSGNVSNYEIPVGEAPCDLQQNFVDKLEEQWKGMADVPNYNKDIGL